MFPYNIFLFLYFHWMDKFFTVNEICIWDHSKHLRWSFLMKQLTAGDTYVKVVNTLMQI